MNSGSQTYPTSTLAANMSLNWSSSKPTNPSSTLGRTLSNGADNTSGSLDNSFKFSREFLLSLYDMDWPLPKDYEANPQATLSSPQPPLANLPLTELEKKLFASSQVNPVASEPLRRANTADNRYVRDGRSAGDREGRSRNINGKKYDRYPSSEREKDQNRDEIRSKYDEWEAPNEVGNLGEEAVFSSPDKSRPNPNRSNTAPPLQSADTISSENDSKNLLSSHFDSPLLTKTRVLADSPEMMTASPRNLFLDIQDPVITDQRSTEARPIGSPVTPGPGKAPIGTPTREGSILEGILRQQSQSGGFDPFGTRSLTGQAHFLRKNNVVSPEDDQFGNGWSNLRGLNSDVVRGGGNIADLSVNHESLNIQWEYKDPTGVVHGPFTPAQMHDWYLGGFFDEGLPIKRFDEPHYEPLIRLIQKNGRERPFLQDAEDFDLRLKQLRFKTNSGLETASLDSYTARPNLAFNPFTSGIGTTNSGLFTPPLESPELVSLRNSTYSFGNSQSNWSNTQKPPVTNLPWVSELGVGGFGRGNSVHSRIQPDSHIQLQSREMLELAYSPYLQQQLLLQQQQRLAQGIQTSNLFAPPQASIFDQLATNQLQSLQQYSNAGIKSHNERNSYNSVIGATTDNFGLSQQQQQILALQQQKIQNKLEEIDLVKTDIYENLNSKVNELQTTNISQDKTDIVEEVADDLEAFEKVKIAEDVLISELNSKNDDVEVVPENVRIEPELIITDHIVNLPNKKKNKRGKKELDRSIMESASETEIEIEDSPVKSIPTAVWANRTVASHEQPKLTLKEIQEIEERAQKERDLEKSKIARQQMLAQAAFLADQEHLSQQQQQQSISGSVWGSAAGTNAMPTFASVPGKGVVRAKTLMEIMHEEETRKKVEVEKKTLALTNTPIGFTTTAPVTVADSGVRRFADAVGVVANNSNFGSVWGNQKTSSPKVISQVSTSTVPVMQPKASSVPIPNGPTSKSNVKDEASPWNVVGKATITSRVTTSGMNIAVRPPVVAVQATSEKLTPKTPATTDSFTSWYRTALKGVAKGGTFNTDEFIQILLSIPLNESSTIMMICDDTLGGVTSIDARKFGDEFIRRRREIVNNPNATLASSTFVGVSTTSNLGMQILSKPIEEMETGNRFVTVGAKNKKKKKATISMRINCE
ncbi:hypothetical protein HK096_000770 [Nowakowskiella sp. JEL0078]|nr:hypothetical protein HK096_000770 [Nowakowskiella sp. JEL0078]